MYLGLRGYHHHPRVFGPCQPAVFMPVRPHRHYGMGSVLWPRPHYCNFGHRHCWRRHRVAVVDPLAPLAVAGGVAAGVLLGAALSGKRRY